MPRHLPVPPVGSPDDVETEFYDALQHGDLDRLMAVWSDDDEISCVHPGGPRLVGAEAIRASYAAMFEHGPVTARPEQVRRLDTMATSVHALVERVAVRIQGEARDAFVVATNVYVKMPRGWRLVVHHASPGTAEPPASPPDAPAGSMLH